MRPWWSRNLRWQCTPKRLVIYSTHAAASLSQAQSVQWALQQVFWLSRAIMQQMMPFRTWRSSSATIKASPYFSATKGPRRAGRLWLDAIIQHQRAPSMDFLYFYVDLLSSTKTVPATTANPPAKTTRVSTMRNREWWRGSIIGWWAPSGYSRL